MLAARSASFAREISLPIFWLWKTETRDKRLDDSGLYVKFFDVSGLEKNLNSSFYFKQEALTPCLPVALLACLSLLLLRQTANVNLYDVTLFSIYLSFTVHYNNTKISRFTLILSIRIILSGFYLHITHFENFSTWISRLPFAVNAMHNFSNDLVRGWLA